jgi:hypothetical protein
MTIQMPGITAVPKQRKTQFITAAAGVVLALATAAGIGAWQASRDGGTTVGDQPAASIPVPAPVQRTVGRTADVAPTIYLVASTADAAAVYAALEETNAVRVTSGEPTHAHRVERIDSAEADAAFLEMMSIDDGIRASLGLPAVRVIDLRPTDQAAPTAPATTSDLRDGVAPRGGMAGLSAAQEADARASVERESRMGGPTERSRDQATAAHGAP